MAKAMNSKGMNRGGMRHGGLVEKPKKPWKTIVRLMGYVKGSTWLLISALLLAVGGTIMQVLSPQMLGQATTLIFQNVSSGTQIQFARLSQTLLTVGLLYFGKFITDALQSTAMTVASQKTTQRLRNDLKKKINQLSSSYFDKHSNGNLMSIAINDMDNIATTLQQSIVQLISSVILLVGTIWMMLTISWQLTLLACLILPASVLVTKLLTPRTQQNFRAYLKTQGALNGQIEESFNGHEIIKSFSNQKEAITDFQKLNEEMYETGWKSKFFGGSMMPAMIFLKNFLYVIIASAGAWQVAASRILIGNLQAFLQYSSQFSQPISQFSMIWNGLLSTVASAERVFDVIDAEERAIYDQEAFPDRPTDTAEVRFDHVQFGYAADQLVMKDFSLAVNKGDMTAIVGHTGAGKTTLVHLLQRFYEISGGSIRIKGTDIRNLSHEELHNKIGMVLQETWLFSGTIYDNIRYGNPNATDEQIFTAAKAAFVDDFVRKLPDGYQTMLNEEISNISQGQKQLITIARAFLSDPEILILDEATSNVDTRTELLIQKAMRKLLKGRTSFVIAHRLSTIYDADEIIVMDQGDVVETGTHRELLEMSGVYEDIYNSQYQGAA
ncbi:ABC transporter ATP-binding protein [Enterococcus sp. BWM-S5]|uniref:ABC transporter ATP-binding protein n=1 Tax=Enterococcus larvae TaxID=2794352 RepID=A0ABS4CMP2_9ENTE|nr:ABC transporter ATP-binding protein [Enterococcus larvae]MBP1047381.1 ABC transporter ATP-binding protein [Enterococcus larvae]